MKEETTYTFTARTLGDLEYNLYEIMNIAGHDTDISDVDYRLVEDSGEFRIAVTKEV